MCLRVARLQQNAFDLELKWDTCTESQHVKWHFFSLQGWVTHLFLSHAPAERLNIEWRQKYTQAPFKDFPSLLSLLEDAVLVECCTIIQPEVLLETPECTTSPNTRMFFFKKTKTKQNLQIRRVYLMAACALPQHNSWVLAVLNGYKDYWLLCKI